MIRNLASPLSVSSVEVSPTSSPVRNAFLVNFMLVAVLSIATLAASGCSDSFVLPDTPIENTPVSGTATASIATAGSVYGGHAPIVGAKVYVLSPSTTANYGVATSLMSSTSSTTGGFPVTKDTSGGVSNNMYYVTSDANGNFNLTGDYACTPNQPVYIAAVGGSPISIGTSANVFNIASVTVSNVTGQAAGAGTATYTFNISGSNPELYYVGQQVTFSNVVIPAGSGGNSNFFNGGIYTVSATGLNTVSFQITFNADYGGYPGAGNAYFPAGTYTQTGATVTATSPANPGVINMAALGLCPSNGTFAGHISYIFMNEISTAALAYATSAFGSDAFHIGVNQTGTLNTTTKPGYVTGSMAQAFNNAYLLYDITGTNHSTTFAGEGHIARLTTPAGNGTVPQSLINTLGNILAACVDSPNTSSSASPQCTQLFSVATANGTTSGTKPTDIATAAFNIAHYPAGTSNSTFATTLFDIPSGNVPFAPDLASAPTDFTIALRFGVNTSYGSTSTNLINNPQILSFDGQTAAGTGLGSDASATNAVWIGSYGAQPVKLFTNGTPDYNANSAGLSGATRSRSVAVDSSGNVWIVNESTQALQEFSDSGTLLASYAAPSNPYVTLFYNGVYAAFDSTGNIYVDYEDFIRKLTSTGTNIPYTGGAANARWSANNNVLEGAGAHSDSVYLDSNGLVYSINSTSGQLCVADPNLGTCKQTIGGFTGTTASNAINFAAIDGNNTFWSPNYNTNTIFGYNYGSSPTAVSFDCTGGGLSQPVAIAIDGSGSIWVANANNASLSTFTSNCGIISTSKGFGPQNYLSTNSADLAVDRSGDIWAVYSGENYVWEYIGLATPAVSPTAFATFNGLIAKRPL